jgi:diguanylate cyclase (GGDEF)-like protein
MHLTLRATIIATFVLLTVLAAVQGGLAIVTTVRSARQITTLEQRGLAPTVGLNMLSQELDQERELLAEAHATLTPDETRAITDEITSLDFSIVRAGPRVLATASLPSWRAAWTNYVTTRGPIILALRRHSGITADAGLDRRLSDRLDSVLDIVLGNAGTQLYTGETLYARTLGSAWDTLRLALVTLVVTLAAAASLAVLISRRLTHGLGNLVATASLVAGGTVTARADEQGNDEIAVLASAFNRMKDALLSAERRAGSDGLTGLPNQTAMIAALDRELERAHRYNRPCSALFLDIDHFKALNDSHGHPAGDTALRDFARVISETIRGVDLLGRWGGEEFLVLLPETDDTNALLSAERLRAAVADYRFAIAGGLHLTCSIGAATYPRDGNDRGLLIDAADRAMYVAKHLGRNQVRSVGDPAVTLLAGDRLADNSREQTAMAGTVEALAALINARDAYTGLHTDEVAALSVKLAHAMGLGAAESRMVGVAARLHDVGKVAIPDAILRKPGRLTEDEWTLMREHPGVAADVVQRVPALRAIAPLIRGHHERWDGTGYPDGLMGEAIPFGARIIAVADAYAAITTERPYRQQSDSAWALAELRRCAGTQFDPAVVTALERVFLSYASDAASAG